MTPLRLLYILGTFCILTIGCVSNAMDKKIEEHPSDLIIKTLESIIPSDNIERRGIEGLRLNMHNLTLEQLSQLKEFLILYTTSLENFNGELDKFILSFNNFIADDLVSSCSQDRLEEMLAEFLEQMNSEIENQEANPLLDDISESQLTVLDTINDWLQSRFYSDVDESQRNGERRGLSELAFEISVIEKSKLQDEADLKDRQCKEKQQEINTLLQQINNLQKNYDNLASKLKELRAETSNTELEKTNLQETNDQLEQEKNGYVQKNAAIGAEKENIASQIRDIDAENDALLNTNKQLETEKSATEEKYESARCAARKRMILNFCGALLGSGISSWLIALLFL